MIRFSNIFTRLEPTEGSLLFPYNNVRAVTQNNPKVLKLAAVNATSKAFRF